MILSLFSIPCSFVAISLSPILSNRKVQPVAKTPWSIDFWQTFDPLSVVMHVWPSFRHQLDKHSLSPWAVFSPMWSTVKYAVCRQQVLQLKVIIYEVHGETWLWFGRSSRWTTNRLLWRLYLFSYILCTVLGGQFDWSMCGREWHLLSSVRGGVFETHLWSQCYMTTMSLAR